MRNLLSKLEIADFEFLFGIIRGPVGLTSDRRLRGALKDFADASDSTEERRALCNVVEREIRYLGSSDVAYLFRKMTRRHGGPGVSFREIVTDVFRKLKLTCPPRICTDEELLEHLVQAHTTSRMRKLPMGEQEALLEAAGMSAGDIANYLKSNSYRFGIPALIHAAGIPAAQRIVTNVVVGTVGNYIGKQVAKTMIGQLVTRFPLWGQWLGPIAWSVTGLWTFYDLQGPAIRKIVPITLFLGLCMLRDGGFETDDAEPVAATARR